MSKSGFYKWRSHRCRKLTEHEKLITKLFHLKKKKAGYRTIRMLLQRRYNETINHKKIRRIMKEHGLLTVIRRRKRNNSYSEHSRMANPFPDLIRRSFNPSHPDRVYSADVTELVYANSQKAYLFAAKDLYAKDIVSYSVARYPDANLVTFEYSKYLATLSKKRRASLIVHTDQGTTFFSDKFTNSLKKLGVQQSMSRKGNCLDNSPIESFFGHMKDEMKTDRCKTLAEVKRTVTNYMKKYNNERPQWGLKGKTPAECRGKY